VVKNEVPSFTKIESAKVIFGLFATLNILPELVHSLIVTLFATINVLPPTADSRPLMVPDTFLTIEFYSSYRLDCIIKSKKPIGVIAEIEF
jgi:hypothetical protein